MKVGKGKDRTKAAMQIIEGAGGKSGSVRTEDEGKRRSAELVKENDIEY